MKVEQIIFDCVDLEDSWVLGWRFISPLSQLIFDLEVSLWQGHEKYSLPLPGEFTCYKRGTLIFNYVTSIDGLLPMDAVKYTTDPDGTIDYGNIEDLRRLNSEIYKFDGDFGEVTVHCGGIRLEINNV